MWEEIFHARHSRESRSRFQTKEKYLRSDMLRCEMLPHAGRREGIGFRAFVNQEFVLSLLDVEKRETN